MKLKSNQRTKTTQDPGSNIYVVSQPFRRMQNPVTGRTVSVFQANTRTQLSPRLQSFLSDSFEECLSCFSASSNQHFNMRRERVWWKAWKQKKATTKKNLNWGFALKPQLYMVWSDEAEMELDSDCIANGAMFTIHRKQSDFFFFKGSRLEGLMASSSFFFKVMTLWFVHKWH